jgi:hypothetical protein
MRAQPFSCFAGIEKDMLPQYECSDRIVLPTTYSVETAIAKNDLLILTNTRNQSVYGTVYGTHDLNPAVLYVPSWMFHLLDLIEPIQIAHTLFKQCTALQIKPHAKAFQKNPEFVNLLKKALYNYRSVVRGVRIPLLIEGEIEYLTIEDMIPSDVDVSLLGDMDVLVLDAYESDAPPLSFLHAPKRVKIPFSFIGRAQKVGGEPVELTPQMAVAEAAKKRAALAAAGKKTY